MHFWFSYFDIFKLLNPFSKIYFFGSSILNMGGKMSLIHRAGSFAAPFLTG
jgi:hypothetical protein